MGRILVERRSSEGAEAVEEGVFLVGGVEDCRVVRWLMAARMVESWWMRWSGTGGAAAGLELTVEERW